MSALSLKGTWAGALRSLAGAVLVILIVRWGLFEPYVIPSGSMLPTLLIKDHILVNKLSYGLRLPFSSTYLIRFRQPQRGDVIVFRSVDDPDIFLVKRVLATEGDELKIGGAGDIWVNGVQIPRRPLEKSEVLTALKDFSDSNRAEAMDHFEVSEETSDRGPHFVFRENNARPEVDQIFKVPPGHLFMMGDNRDHSSDSRVWGMLGVERVLGRASFIWLSCEEPLAESGQLCDPQNLRWSRIMTRIP